MYKREDDYAILVFSCMLLSSCFSLSQPANGMWGRKRFWSFAFRSKTQAVYPLVKVSPPSRTRRSDRNGKNMFLLKIICFCFDCHFPFCWRRERWRNIFQDFSFSCKGSIEAEELFPGAGTRIIWKNLFGGLEGNFWGGGRWYYWWKLILFSIGDSPLEISPSFMLKAGALLKLTQW